MIPLKYNIGNLKARSVSTAMSILGIGVVIAVMLSMMALYNGVQKATTSNASRSLMMILREGAQAESTSWVSKDAFRIIRSLGGIAKGANGQPLVSPEIVINFKIPKKNDNKGSNIVVRGVTPAAFEIRPYVKLVEGQMFRPDSSEVIVSRRIRSRFQNMEVGDTFQFGPQQWRVAGVFEAPDTAYDSEMWGDANYIGQARKRDAYSSVFVQTVDQAGFDSVKSSIVNDNRLKQKVRSEKQYYEEQSTGILGIVILVGIVTFFMMIAATLATMNTMFTAIAARKRELATLRAIGFKRRTVILAVVIESAAIALVGGIVGVILALPVNTISTGTVNWQTFSEVAFNFAVDAKIAAFGLVLALVAGVIGGVLPAIGAARMPITRALREV